VLQRVAVCCSVLQCVADFLERYVEDSLVHYDALLSDCRTHTATPCNTLQRKCFNTVTLLYYSPVNLRPNTIIIENLRHYHLLRPN